MTYQASLKPLTREEMAEIPCFRYINPRVSEADLEQWDRWFKTLRRKPEVYSITVRKRLVFRVHLNEQEKQVDWRIYRTWDNSFHLRYQDILESLGIKCLHPHIDREQQIQVVERLVAGEKPKRLVDCRLPVGSC